MWGLWPGSKKTALSIEFLYVLVSVSVHFKTRKRFEFLSITWHRYWCYSQAGELWVQGLIDLKYIFNPPFSFKINDPRDAEAPSNANHWQVGDSPSLPRCWFLILQFLPPGIGRQKEIRLTSSEGSGGGQLWIVFGGCPPPQFWVFRCLAWLCGGFVKCQRFLCQSYRSHNGG